MAFTDLVNENTVNSLLMVLFALFINKANPEIPRVNKYFESIYFKLAFIFAFTYLTNNKNVQVAAVVTGVVAVVTYLLKKEAF